MERGNEDDRSIEPFLPLSFQSSAVFWPPVVVEALKSISDGPTHSNVSSGGQFALTIADLRNSLEFSSLHPSASPGFSLFFHNMMSKDESKKWFNEVVSRLADLLLVGKMNEKLGFSQEFIVTKMSEGKRLPALLETHYRNAGVKTGVRLLESQQSGIVVLSQELIAALLVCALFCLFPTTDRCVKHLRPINFEYLFVCLYERKEMSQEHKIKCLVHYFEKICSDMPMGNVSFERKVIPLENSPSCIVYPEPDFWKKSTVSLCPLEVHTSGLIEDQLTEALEVDFANKSIGGGALRRGSVQEEIRFMINPELIASLLFLPTMADNETIEIIGTQRFSNYTGYAKSFRFSGPHVDKKSVDTMGRRKTRIIAMDALSRVGKRQYTLECLLRETNKAFCGFLDHQKYENALSSSSFGVATGNWGCGAFGGDPEVKTIIQWLSASQANRPFVVYYTFGLEPLEKLEKIVTWIQSQGWSVGEVWSRLVEYSNKRVNKKTKVGFFRWLLPSLDDDHIE